MDVPSTEKTPKEAFAGRYVLTDVIGRGGMGEVSRAYDSELRRHVAIKRMLGDARDASDTRRARLMKEARAAAQLNHANIVTVYDIGTSEGVTFVVMELAQGGSLEQRIKSSAPWSLSQALDWLAEAAEALAVAHDAGLVHRDIKPANLLLTSDDHIKVADFGIVKEIDTATRDAGPLASSNVPLTRAGAAVGTPRYMAPEQLRGEHVDGRADQYAWGVVAYQLLAAEHPYDGATTPVTAQHVADGLVVPMAITDRTPAVAPELERVVLRALAAEPGARFPDMRAAKAALAEARGTSDGETETTLIGPTARAPVDTEQEAGSTKQMPDAPTAGAGPGNESTADLPADALGPTILAPLGPDDFAPTLEAPETPAADATTASPVERAPASRTWLTGAAAIVVLGGGAFAGAHFMRQGPPRPVATQPSAAPTTGVVDPWAAPGRAPGPLAIHTTSLTSSLASSEVQAIAERSRHRLAACAPVRPDGTPLAPADVVLLLTVRPSGQVHRHMDVAGIVREDKRTADARACIIGIATYWPFPRHEKPDVAGVVVRIRFGVAQEAAPSPPAVAPYTAEWVIERPAYKKRRQRYDGVSVIADDSYLFFDYADGAGACVAEGDKAKCKWFEAETSGVAALEIKRAPSAGGARFEGTWSVDEDIEGQGGTVTFRSK